MLEHDPHLTDHELLLALDGELPSRRHAPVETHLARCAACRTRRARIEQAVLNMTALYKDDGVVHAGRARDGLRSKLNEMADKWDGSFALRLSARVMPTPRWMMAGAALAAAVVLLAGGLSSSRGVDSSGGAASIEPDALPVASLTPGASRDLSVGELCNGGVREEEEISPALRRAVLRDYGMEHVPNSEYELDYLITPELGGAPDARNLWPQRYSSRTWNARVKDQLERLLPRLVCNRDVALETAQRDIARDWIAAYRKYFKTDTPLQPQGPDVHAVRLAPEKGVRPLFLLVSASYNDVEAR